MKRSPRRSALPRLLVTPSAVRLWIALLACVAGALSLSALWEQDIFWQVRAGDEILHGHLPQRVDEWSSTGLGKSWLNIQWLATIALRVMYAAAAEEGLVVWRGLMVALLMALVGVAVARMVAPESRLAVLGIILPWVYAATAFRLQLRSDLFVLVVFAALLVIWSGDKSARSKRLLSVVCVGLSANLHQGTAPFVVALALAAIGADWRGRSDLGWSVACAAAYFLTPYGFDVIDVLVTHIFYYEHSVMANPDHQALDPRHHLSVARFGIGGIAWVVFMAVGWLGYLFLKRRGRLLPRPVSRALVLLPVALLFTALALQRIRVFPYAALLFAPVVATLLDDRLRAGRAAVVRATIASLAVASLFFVTHAATSRLPWGIEVSPRTWPTGAAAFIERARPKKNIYHTYAYGNYLVWHLRDYPVFVDTRESPFRDIQQATLDAYYSPSATRRLIASYDVNTVLLPIPKTAYVPGMGFRDVIDEYLPRQEWAVVYFDDIAFVAVRRIPEHEAIIADNEYEILRPSLPPDTYVRSGNATIENDARFQIEVARCRRDEPNNAFCVAAETAWLARQSKRR